MTLMRGSRRQIDRVDSRAACGDNDGAFKLYHGYEGVS